MGAGKEKQKSNKAKLSRRPPNALPSSVKKDGNVKEDSAAESPPKASLPLQQQCLDTFRNALQPSHDNDAILQKIKGHLYNRDFVAAFGKESYLRIYASRWSPSRGLAYLDVFGDVLPFLDPGSSPNANIETSVLCLGGGAGAELVALAARFNDIQAEAAVTSSQRLEVALLDMADWTSVVDSLHEGIVTAPQLSKYASQAKKNVNRAMVNANDISVSFRQKDVLAEDDSDMSSLVDNFAKANLITFMFTLNELYSTSVSKAQLLLARITAAVKPGTLLLVVDSPGSYSTVSLNGSEKKYPMQWLLDYTLLGASKLKTSSSTDAKWEKVMDDSSRWFRLPDGLDYPIELEDMRYQLHLYRRLNDHQED